jgi:hypothetical protein
MTPLALTTLAEIFVAALVFAFVVDFIKVPVFNRLGIA